MPEDYAYFYYKIKMIRKGLCQPKIFDDENLEDIMKMNEILKAEKYIELMKRATTNN